MEAPILLREATVSSKHWLTVLSRLRRDFISFISNFYYIKNKTLRINIRRMSQYTTNIYLCSLLPQLSLNGLMSRLGSWLFGVPELLAPGSDVNEWSTNSWLPMDCCTTSVKSGFLASCQVWCECIIELKWAPKYSKQSDVRKSLWIH